MNETIWEPVKEAGNLTDKIVLRIEQLIQHNELGAGERLPSERDLAKMLGVSRPALREAVKTLEAHGRVTVRHGQGVFVTASTDDLLRSRLVNQEVSMTELYAMRNVLETPAAAWAASFASDEDHSRLEDSLVKLEAARTPPIDFELLGHLDSSFHLLIVELAKNRFLLQTVGILQELMAAGMETTLSFPGRLERAAQDHRAIFNAIVNHDPEAARIAAASHILGARDAALARIRNELRLDADARTELAIGPS